MCSSLKVYKCGTLKENKKSLHEPKQPQIHSWCILTPCWVIPCLHTLPSTTQPMDLHLPPSYFFPSSITSIPSLLHYTVYFSIFPCGSLELRWWVGGGCLQNEVAHRENRLLLLPITFGQGEALWNPFCSAFSFSLCRGPSAVPWWTSCGFPSSASAGSNTSPNLLSWWKRRRSSTCTPSTTADCQGKRPWPKMGIWITFSPSLLQWGGVQRHWGKGWG